jgi:hypothetical protein
MTTGTGWRPCKVHFDVARLALKAGVCIIELETGDPMLERRRRPPLMAGLALCIDFGKAFLFTVAFLTRKREMESVQRPAGAPGVVKCLHGCGDVAGFTFVRCMA